MVGDPSLKESSKWIALGIGNRPAYHALFEIFKCSIKNKPCSQVKGGRVMVLTLENSCPNHGFI